MQVRTLTDRGALASYTRDESSAFEGRADLVYLPRTPEELAWVLAEARQRGLSLTFSGAGTSITGSRVPEGGAVVSLEGLRRVEELPGPPEAADAWPLRSAPDHSIMVSHDHRHAVVPAGVRLFELDALLAGDGVCYPPDPTEQTAMLGGTIATNASGARSYRYGATREWIEALLVVPMGGKPRWIHRGDWSASGSRLPLPPDFPADAVEIPTDLRMPATKHAAGLYLTPGMDLIDLLVGSEGSLAAVAGAVLRLTPRPEAVLHLAGFYDAEEAVFAAADRMREDPAVLSIEYMDGAALDFIRRRYHQTPRAAGALLLEVGYHEQEAQNPYPSEARLGEIASRLRGGPAESSGTEGMDSGGLQADWAAVGEDVRGMRSFRHALPEQVNHWVGERMGKLGTDMAVPAAQFPEMWRSYRAVRDAGIRTVLFGHLGQYHLHLNFLPETPEERARARELYRELARRAVELGGTISAEHGVGKKQLEDEAGRPQPYLSFMYGWAGIRAMQAVKRSFDPEWLLNPGTMLPHPQERGGAGDRQGEG